jgi:integrase
VIDSDKFVIEFDKLREPKVISFGEAAGFYDGHKAHFKVVVIRALKSVLDESTIPPADKTRENTGERNFPVPRGRHQDGHFRKRGKKYELRFREYFVNPDGTITYRHRSVVLGAFKKKKLAQESDEAARLLREVNQGARQPQFDITFSDFWFQYFEPEIVSTKKHSTRRLYRILARKHLLPALGKKKLPDISRLEVQQLIGEKHRQGKSPQTLRHLRNLLSNVFGVAVSWSWLNDNPARDIRLPAMERVRKARTLTQDEAERLPEALENPVRLILLMGLLTGLRIGELLALRVEDVDLSRGLVYVRRDVYCGQVGSTKTPSSERRVPLARVLLPFIHAWLAVRSAQSEWLFPSEAGTPFQDRNLLRRKLWPACDRLEIPRFGWHSLRHTFVTVALSNGVPLPVVKAIVGQKGSDVTMLYFHSLEPEARRAVETVAGVLCPTVPKVENYPLTPTTGRVLIQ